MDQPQSSTITSPLIVQGTRQRSLGYWLDRVRLNPKLLELTVPKLTKYIPHKPTVKQTAFLLLNCREALFGGAAGGGKSDALLMAALQYVDVAGYAALLLRRTYKDLALPNAIMDRARNWLSSTDARWSDQDKTWYFPTFTIVGKRRVRGRDATITFGYLETEKDKYRYQSAEFQMVGFDELTQFPLTQYRYLFSRLRRLKGVNVPLRMRGATNPGGISHEDVKQRFFIEERDGDRVLLIPGKEGRVFISAKLTDNPHLDQAEYVSSLQELDPITRAQLLAGDWSARVAGAKFKREWFEIVDHPPADARRVRYWDMAATENTGSNDPDWTAGCKMSRDTSGIFYIEDMRHVQASPMRTEQLVKQTAQLDGVGCAIYMEQEPGSSGVTVIDHYTRVVLAGYEFRGDKVTGDKAFRANPLSSMAEAGNVKLVRGPWIHGFLDEAEAFTGDGEGHDDRVDAASGAYSKLATGTPGILDFMKEEAERAEAELLEKKGR